jgi:formylglycine-generating enzyme
VIRRAALAGAACALLGGCGDSLAAPRPQWEVTIGSDAPVPAIFDRLLVEVLDENGTPCEGCSRLFGLASPGDLPLSFGVAAPEGDGELRIRVRLFRAARLASDGSPDARWSIDLLGRLPKPAGVDSIGLPLFMDCLGVAADPDEHLSCDPESRVLAPEPWLGAQALPVTGSWPPAAEVPCPPDHPTDTVCVPGGLFVMGGDNLFAPLASFEALPEQLVQLPPFAIDRDEVTVGVFLSVAAGLPGRPGLHVPDYDDTRWMCTYLGDDVHDNDALPVNCITAELAAATCAALDRRLPTEAEWEYAAGNASLETVYPWGDDSDNLCAKAIVGRGRNVVESDAGGLESSACRSQDDVIGPAPAGTSPDVSLLGIRDLAGNVSEILADSFAPYGEEPCWSPTVQLLVNPRCSASAPLRAARGGSYANDPQAARVVGRDAADPAGELFAGGFRCAKSF